MIRDSILSDNITGLSAMGSGTPEVEGTAFENNNTAVYIGDTAIADLGGGAKGSSGFNTIIGTSLSVDNQTANPIPARSNWWGCPTTAEMDAGQANITLIYDEEDDPLLGPVDFTGWLGGTNRNMTVQSDTAAGARDIVLTWPQEPTGSLTILRGTDPQSLSSVGSTAESSWRDVGALDSPEPLLFYDIDGPCP